MTGNYLEKPAELDGSSSSLTISTYHSNILDRALSESVDRGVLYERHIVRGRGLDEHDQIVRITILSLTGNFVSPYIIWTLINQGIRCTEFKFIAISHGVAMSWENV
jgi:hypothetical protein